MKVGPYTLTRHAFTTSFRTLLDAQAIRRDGIPRLDGGTPNDVARLVLRRNAGAILRAGEGHFHAMWVADTGKAFNGAREALSVEYLAGLLSRVVRTSARVGRVPTCFTPKGWHDLPWPRADGLPWLLHMVDRLDDPAFVADHHRDLQKAWDDWRAAHLDPTTGLIREEVTGDWMDTVPRPSSTYNNLMGLRAAQAARRLDLAGEGPDEKALLASRWTGAHLRDHARSGDYLSADANVPALYHGLLPRHVRRRIATSLETSLLATPIGMRTREGAYTRDEFPLATRLAPAYHSTRWLHWGLMHVIGLQRNDLPWQHQLTPIRRLTSALGNFIETLDDEGRPFATPWIATEHGFTMSAGLYLEATSPSDLPIPSPQDAVTAPASHQQAYLPEPGSLPAPLQEPPAQ